jgi:hypothetical protein
VIAGGLTGALTTAALIFSWALNDEGVFAWVVAILAFPVCLTIFSLVGWIIDFFLDMRRRKRLQEREKRNEKLAKSGKKRSSDETAMEEMLNEDAQAPSTATTTIPSRSRSKPIGKDFFFETEKAEAPEEEKPNAWRPRRRRRRPEGSPVTLMIVGVSVIVMGMGCGGFAAVVLGIGLWWLVGRAPAPDVDDDRIQLVENKKQPKQEKPKQNVEPPPIFEQPKPKEKFQLEFVSSSPVQFVRIPDPPTPNAGGPRATDNQKMPYPVLRGMTFPPDAKRGLPDWFVARNVVFPVDLSDYFRENKYTGLVAPNSPLWDTLAEGMRNQRFRLSGLVGGNGGKIFLGDLPNDGGLLIGFLASKDRFFPYLQPIYLTRNGEQLGRAYGTPTRNIVCYKAKPGYAVGGMFVHAGDLLNGLSLTYMKVEESGLNTSDWYQSGWVGTDGGFSAIVGHEGLFVVGIHGRMLENDYIAPKSSLTTVGTVSLLPGPPKDKVVKGGNAPPIDGLIAHWSFDKAGPEDIVLDSSGRNNHGKGFKLKQVDGMKGFALQFENDRDQYFDFSASTDFNHKAGGDFTYTGWFRTTNPDGTILWQGSGKALIHILLEGGKLRAVIKDDLGKGPGDLRTSGKKELNNGRWRHFGLVREGDRCMIYVDGAQQAGSGGPVIGKLSSITSTERAIGSDRSVAKNRFEEAAAFQGAIDEVRIYQRALSREEMRALGKSP